MPNDPPEPPNPLRAARTAAFLTIDTLAARTVTLAQQDSERFTQVSRSTISKLELGHTKKPRPRSAITLATALHTTVETLFPDGLDDGNRLIDSASE